MAVRLFEIDSTFLADFFEMNLELIRYDLRERRVVYFFECASFVELDPFHLMKDVLDFAFDFVSDFD